VLETKCARKKERERDKAAIKLISWLIKEEKLERAKERRSKI
jgi:hypothetical protein